MVNGFTFTGEAACVSPENFNPVIGNERAYRKAFDNIWQFEGYLLAERKYQASQPAVEQVSTPLPVTLGDPSATVHDHSLTPPTRGHHLGLLNEIAYNPATEINLVHDHQVAPPDTWK
jgi:hypothetical protein